ncbi:MAG: serine/threonine-protein kinase [Anaerolineae bacterium]|nr:serine/threonine-protein kinase [Anaerolineae bacterium]
MTELVGQSLGQYEIIEEIAKGGMATVYKARQTSIGRDVAVKVLPPNFTHDETFLERFYREVEVIAQLQHPHILPVYDFGKYENMPYIVMAYIDGGTLTDRIAKGAIPPTEVARMVHQIAQALDFAHSKGIVHRDFKPSNVLLDERGNTYLADFGLAKITESSSNITGTMILGTPDYMAPEQATSGTISESVDVYALGVTIYQMLTGQAPYEAPTAAGVLVAHITQPIPDIRKTRPDLPMWYKK